MEKFIDELNSFFKTTITNDFINKELKNKIKIRNAKNGIKLHDAILYLFYSVYIQFNKNTSVIKINRINRSNTNNMKCIHRTAYFKKEKRIPLEIYKLIYLKLDDLYKKYNNKYLDKNKYIAIDGTNNNNLKDAPKNKNNISISLNMGYYDISNNSVIDLSINGNENRNQEIKCATKYIRSNIDKFKNSTIIADRAYFSYEFINFLIENGINIIIRSKGDAKYLETNNKNLNKTNKKDLINKIKGEINVITFEDEYEKTIFSRKTKSKKSKKYTFTVKNNCKIITNLKNISKDEILKMYRKIWDIETFFKLIKYNFNFSNISEKSRSQLEKQNVCILIITKLVDLFSIFYMNKYKTLKKKDNYSIKINKSILINGIIRDTLRDILMGELTETGIKFMFNNCVYVNENKIDRKFPRFSKTPFTKWNCKSYSVSSQLIKILDAIVDNTVEDLNKNLKLKVATIKNLIRHDL